MSRKEKERKENEIMIISSERICVLLLLIAMSRRVMFPNARVLDFSRKSQSIYVYILFYRLYDVMDMTSH